MDHWLTWRLHILHNSLKADCNWFLLNFDLQIIWTQTSHLILYRLIISQTFHRVLIGIQIHYGCILPIFATTSHPKNLLLADPTVDDPFGWKRIYNLRLWILIIIRYRQGNPGFHCVECLKIRTTNRIKIVINVTCRTQASLLYWVTKQPQN